MRTLRAGVEREAIREFIIFADAGSRLHRRHRHAADIYLERRDMVRIADRVLHGGAVTLLKNKTDIKAIPARLLSSYNLIIVLGLLAFLFSDLLYHIYNNTLNS